MSPGGSTSPSGTKISRPAENNVRRRGKNLLLVIRGNDGSLGVIMGNRSNKNNCQFHGTTVVSPGRSTFPSGTKTPRPAEDKVRRERKILLVGYGG